MPYDEVLAERVRSLTLSEPGISERRMFGGLAFLVHGNMAVAVSGAGGLLVRADPEGGDELRQEPAVEPMVMRGRAMQGWLRVPAASVRAASGLERWVALGIGVAQALPRKD